MTQADFYSRLDSFLESEATFDLIPPLIGQAKTDGLSILVAFQRNEKGESVAAYGMAGLEADTIGGFNSMIERQKQAEGEALVSTVLFSNSSTVIHDRVDLRKIEPLTDRQYFVGGGTALIDAIGGAIHHIAMVHKYAREEDRPDRTIFVITTDGMENASRHYTSDEVKAMVKKEKEQYSWEFLFLGANIDAVETAAHFGIGADRSVTFKNDSRGQQLNYDVVGKAVLRMRECAAPMAASWKDEIEEDVRTRGR